MHDKPIRLSSRHGHVTPGNEVRAALQRRFDSVSACLNALPIDLPWKFQAELAPMLQPPSVRELPAPPEEVSLLNKLLDHIARGVSDTDPTTFVKYLAAAMFYFLPYELPLTPPPSQLPLWVRVPYLKWSLALPQCLCDSGEAEDYASWLEEWLKVLGAEFVEGQGLEDVPEYQRHRLLWLVAQQLKVLETDFHQGHLLPIAQARATSIDSALQALGLALKESLPVQIAAPTQAALV